MKKYRIVAVFVMILLMGCGSAQNGKMKESSTMKESEETISIKTYDWNHARIKDMVDMQCFGNGPIVQNENYIFYPKDGYKVARVDKEKKDEKIIYEFTPSKEEGVGVHITLGEEKMLLKLYQKGIWKKGFRKILILTIIRYGRCIIIKRICILCRDLEFMNMI